MLGIGRTIFEEVVEKLESIPVACGDKGHPDLLKTSNSPLIQNKLA